MNSLEETKYLMMKRKERLEGTQENIAKRNLLQWYKKVQFSPKKYRYLEWTEGRGNNGKECTTEEKSWSI